MNSNTRRHPRHTATPKAHSHLQLMLSGGHCCQRLAAPCHARGPHNTQTDKNSNSRPQNTDQRTQSTMQSSSHAHRHSPCWVVAPCCRRLAAPCAHWPCPPAACCPAGCCRPSVTRHQSGRWSRCRNNTSTCWWAGLQHMPRLRGQ